jgi:hypothetical protein
MVDDYGLLPYNVRRFGGPYRLHLQGQRGRKAKIHLKQAAIGLLFHLEDIGDIYPETSDSFCNT